MRLSFRTIRGILLGVLLCGILPAGPALPPLPPVPQSGGPILDGAPKSTPKKTPAPQKNNGEAPKAPAKPLPEIKWKGRSYLDIKQIGARFGFQATTGMDGKDRTITLTTPRGETIVFTVTKQLFQVSGTAASLSFPVAFEKDRFLLEKTDYTEFLEPLLRPTTLPRRTIRHILLDPGHGGNDQGASKGKTLEKTLNLLMARKIAAILRKRGYTVSMTRTSDLTVSLEKRCQIATAKKPDLFLSIHCNSAEDATIHGIEVWIANPPGVPSFGTTTNGKTGASTPYQKTSALWAYFTQRALLKETKALDRGVKRKQFKVIIDSPAPAMLVELGFLSNKEECKKLLQAAYQDKLAVAICDSIDRLKRSLKPKK